MEPPVKKKKNPWVWVGVGCGVVFAGFVAVIAFVVFIVFGAMRKSEPYQHAMAVAQSDPRVIAALGSPVRGGFFFSGSMHSENRDGDAKFDIPIWGPKGTATLRVTATKMRGRWYYNQIVVTPKKGEEIDLMTSPEGSTSTAPPAG